MSNVLNYFANNEPLESKQKRSSKLQWRKGQSFFDALMLGPFSLSLHHMSHEGNRVVMKIKRY